MYAYVAVSDAHALKHFQPVHRNDIFNELLVFCGCASFYSVSQQLVCIKLVVLLRKLLVNPKA